MTDSPSKTTILSGEALILDHEPPPFIQTLILYPDSSKPAEVTIPLKALHDLAWNASEGARACIEYAEGQKDLEAVRVWTEKYKEALALMEWCSYAGNP